MSRRYSLPFRSRKSEHHDQEDGERVAGYSEDNYANKDDPSPSPTSNPFSPRLPPIPRPSPTNNSLSPQPVSSSFNPGPAINITCPYRPTTPRSPTSPDENLLADNSPLEASIDILPRSPTTPSRRRRSSTSVRSFRRSSRSSEGTARSDEEEAAAPSVLRRSFSLRRRSSSAADSDTDEENVSPLTQMREELGHSGQAAKKWVTDETRGLNGKTLVAFLWRLLTIAALMVLVWIVLVQVNLEINRKEDPSKVEISRRALFVDGQPYFVRGVNYNPIPRGYDGQEPPYGDYYSTEYSSDKVNWRTLLSSFYTNGSLWEGLANKFLGYAPYHDAHLKEIRKTFNTIRVYSFNLEKDHSDFLDLCRKYGLMVIVTFWMDSRIYTDLTDDTTLELALSNFRHVVRTNKGHPAILMWAIGLEPNDPARPSSYSDNLAMFFDFMEPLRHVRDDEETAAGYHPHPLMVPLADFEFSKIVADYDKAHHEVWGVQPYRGETFGDLYRSFISAKPLVVSEYGMDAYHDVILTEEMVDCQVLDEGLEADGEAYQDRAILRLATEVEAQNSQEPYHIFLASGLHRGSQLDDAGGYAVVEYNNFSNIVHYTLSHQNLRAFDLAGLVNDSYPYQVNEPYITGSERLQPQTVTTAGATTDASAECQIASGLRLCSELNGQHIGTCYSLSEIDSLAQQIVDAFGGGNCALSWACTSLATCFHSSNPRHWCIFANATVCADAFDACGVTHVPSPDYPVSLTHTPATPSTTSMVDPDTPTSVSTRTIQGRSLTLAFSEEFTTEGRTFGYGHDAKWEAVDLHETSDTQTFKPTQVQTSGGSAVFTFEANTTFDREQRIHGYRSARLQGWNKVCFSGGYVEARLKLPGSPYVRGLKAAFSLLGNLGRLGYPASLEGLWPWSYNTCDTVAASGQSDWNNSAIGAQKFSACGDWSADYGFAANVGRGVPQADVLVSEVPAGAWDGTRGAHLISGLTVGPKIPPNTAHGAGSTGDCTHTADKCTGIRVAQEFRHDTGMDSYCMSTTDGQLADTVHDCVSADINVYETHFDSYHTYGLYIEPDQSMVWYVDGLAVFTLNSSGLTSKTNPDNTSQTVAARHVPTEPLYMALGLSSVDASSVTLPAEMQVDYVRLWQGTDHTLGCDPAGHPTAAYAAAKTDVLGVSVCGNGVCDAGECEQCPADCTTTIACRQDCRVPRCQLREPTFNGGTGGHWAFQILETTIRATITWYATGARVDILHSGWLPRHLILTQGHQLLCQGFRYRISVTGRASTGNGTVTVAVNSSSIATLVSFDVTLSTAFSTTYHDFHVPYRVSDGSVSLQMGVNNDYTILEFTSVSLCPVPSVTQHCYGAPRQVPEDPLQALANGRREARALSADGSVQAVGGLTFFKAKLPDFRADLRADVDLDQPSDTNFTGRAFFWADNATDDGGTRIVEWLVVHSSPWFATGRAVQAIAVHWKASRPTPANLIAPLYCNADVTARADAVVNCSEYGISSIATVYGSGTPSASTSFRSVRSVSPYSADYELLNPLHGTLRLTDLEYQHLQSDSGFVVLYLENDPTPYGRIRGPIVESHQASCVGGVAFEFHDEWWKGSSDDTWHTECHKDDEGRHSTCGRSAPGFGPDNRLNEEWFGLYNASYRYDDDDHIIELRPRTAVFSLQQLWNRSTAAEPVTVRAAVVTPRAAAAGPAGAYTNYFPKDVEEFSFVYWLLVIAGVLMLAMVALIVVNLTYPYLSHGWFLLVGDSALFLRICACCACGRTQQGLDCRKCSLAVESDTRSGTVRRRTVDEWSSCANDSEYDRVRRFVQRLADFSLRLLSKPHDELHVITTELVPLVAGMRKHDGGAVRLSTLVATSDFEGDEVKDVAARHPMYLQLTEDGEAVMLGPLGEAVAAMEVAPSFIGWG